MIQRVYEQALQCELLDRVVIATDDQRIAKASTTFGGDVLMTSKDHQNGTERCAEVATQIEADHYVNIQGDEPFIHPDQIELVCRQLVEGASIATLKKRIDETSQLLDVNVVKVVSDLQEKALYFSRSPIPAIKNEPQENWLSYQPFYKHIGIYGFDRSTLLKIVALSPTALEQAESLEQLRWLSNGFPIRIAETDQESIGIDVPEDIERALLIFQP